MFNQWDSGSHYQIGTRAVNGKPYWIDENAKYAVWYNGENGTDTGWKFGNANNIGSHDDGVLMWSNDDHYTPALVSHWISTNNNFECTSEDPAKSHVWHGESSIASWNYLGGYNTYHGHKNAMFDYRFEDNHMYHSKRWYGSNYGGVVINFNTPIKFDDLRIYTRSICCRINRYQGVCLYADNVKIACTPDDFGDPGPIINFKYHLISTSPVIASEYKLSWDYWDRNSDERSKLIPQQAPDLIKRYAQIEELFLYYTPVTEPTTETTPEPTARPTLGKGLGHH